MSRQNSQNLYLILFLASTLLFISMGIRQSFGLLLVPLENYSWQQRDYLSLVFALQNLIFAIPIYGFMIEKYGYQKVSRFGALTIIIGFLGVIFFPQAITLMLGLALLVGIGLGQNGFIISLGSIAQVSPDTQKSTFFGIATAFASLGMFCFVPFTQWLLNNFSFRNSLFQYVFWGILLLIISWGLPQYDRQPRENQKKKIFKNFFSKTFKNKNYLFLNIGFLVCGFHVAFIALHLPAYLQSNNISANTSAWTLSLIGLMNILGSFFWGKIGDKRDKRIILSFIYFLRAVVIFFLIFLPLNKFIAISFGAIIGFLWLGTVPLTSGLVYQFFNGECFNTRYNIVFFSHQIGAFLGIYLGGYFFQLYNSYDQIWYLAIILGFLSGIIHLFIRNKN